jgi:hypothetical protein
MEIFSSWAEEISCASAQEISSARAKLVSLIASAKQFSKEIALSYFF